MLSGTPGNAGGKEKLSKGCKEKTPFDRMRVRSANCTNKSKRDHFASMPGDYPVPNALSAAERAWISVVSYKGTDVSFPLTNRPISVQPRMTPCAPSL